MGNGNGPTAPPHTEVPPPGDDDYLQRPRAEESTARPAPEVINLEHLTETSNAERFVQQNLDAVKLVVEWSRWIAWSELLGRWEEDPGEIRLQRRIKDSHRRLYEEAAACRDDKVRERIAAWAKSSERRASREATAKLARSEPGVAISHERLDSDPMLLGVANATLDLRVGEPRAPQRDDLITMVIPVSYDPLAQCPRWERFLLEILPDPATVGYVQRAIGYSLTASVREQALFVLWGAGANGKSTMLLVLLELLGPYATQAPADLLLARRGEAHPTELTVLHRRRLVVAQETENNRRWAEASVKQLTGGDRVVARRMREDFWQFDPTHKLWLATNHRPSVRGTDEGIWRRLKLIPFERVIPPADRDPALAQQLRAELPGILRWAVQGCLAWQREGLGEPAAVTGAVADYRAAEDRLAPFLDERCVLEPGARISRGQLRIVYEAWALANGEGRPLGPKEFAAQLRQRGLADGKIRSGGESVRGWSGIRLREQQEPPR